MPERWDEMSVTNVLTVEGYDFAIKAFAAEHFYFNLPGFERALNTVVRKVDGPNGQAQRVWFVTESIVPVSILLPMSEDYSSLLTLRLDYCGRIEDGSWHEGYYLMGDGLCLVDYYEQANKTGPNFRKLIDYVDYYQ